jgi:hypothetical protein
MRKETQKIQVKDRLTEQTLFECDLEQSETAYARAAEYEEMGLDVQVINPTLSQTLTSSLGLNLEEVRKYEESLTEEIENHDEGSCCFEDTDKDKLH